MSWEQGSYEAKRGGGHGGSGDGGSTGWVDTYMVNSYGSSKAKRNMWRGHRYSRKRK